MAESSLERKRRYILSVLALHPARDAAQILHLRAQALGLKTVASVPIAAVGELKKRREGIQIEIDALRQQFWTMSPQNLKSRIEAIDVADFPELQPAVMRLQSVFEVQTEFAKLQRHPHFQINLFNTLKRIVTLPARDAGVVKEAYLRNVADSAALGETKKMISILRAEFPMIFQMEADWLDEIVRTGGRRKQVEKTEGIEIELPIPGWLIGLIVLIILRVLISIVAR